MSVIADIFNTEKTLNVGYVLLWEAILTILNVCYVKYSFFAKATLKFSISIDPFTTKLTLVKLTLRVEKLSC